MEKHYNFKNAKKNPYTDSLKKEIKIKLSNEVLDYFAKLSEETGIPYQTLINFYLLDCVKNKKTIEMLWK